MNEGTRDEKRIVPLTERTFEFAVRIVRMCMVLDEKGRTASSLPRQVLKSGTSIGANVEEGMESQSEADFLAKYSIACKEARETHYWLRLLVTTEILPENNLLL